MNIHSCHMVFAVSLYHAQELPTVSFIKRGMVGNQINRSDSLGFHIFHNHIEQMPCDTFAAVVFLCIDRTDIWCKIFSVVKVIFDYTHTAYDFVAVQTKIPTISMVTLIQSGNKAWRLICNSFYPLDDVC